MTTNEQNFGVALLPAQYNSLLRRTSYSADAEKALMFAVLLDAVRLCLSDRKAKSRYRRIRFEETRRWFRESAEQGGHKLVAYENLCEALGMDPNRLRARLGLNRPSSEAACGGRYVRLRSAGPRLAVKRITRKARP